MGQGVPMVGTATVHDLGGRGGAGDGTGGRLGGEGSGKLPEACGGGVAGNGQCKQVSCDRVQAVARAL